MITDFIEGAKERYNVSEIAQNEWLEFAMYTVESRAIPNMIDSLKPVQRFYLYSSIENSNKEFKKVSAVAGIISQYGYNHGETSAASAGQLMAADWNNNITLVEGRGSFGTRLIPAAAAARYTYTKLHRNFDKYMKDHDLCPAHDDPEHEPPAFYLPVIPLVLVNGVKGIATGFATNILPRDPKDISKACLEYIKTGEIKSKIPIKFPHFRGKTEMVEDGKYVCYGSFEKKGKTVLEITEVPYGFDREGYVKVLDSLEDAGDIVGYDDRCGKDGFGFEVKLKQTSSAKWDDAKIYNKFKLAKPFSENITVIDQNGKLKEYNDERDLIKDFCDYRFGVLTKRIEARQKEYSEELRWLKVKLQFVRAVLDDKIVFKGKKKANVVEQILSATDASKEDADKLLRMNIISLTSEMVDELVKQIKVTEKTLKFWETTTETKQFVADIEELGVD